MENTIFNPMHINHCFSMFIENKIYPSCKDALETVRYKYTQNATLWYTGYIS